MPQVRVNGFAMDYLVRGSGPAQVVLCHGFTSAARYWDEVLARVPDSVTALAVSLRGHGDSEATADPVGIAGFAADLAVFIEAVCSPPVAVVGHSMGGAIAMQLALDRPDLVRALVLDAPVPAGGLPGMPEAVIADIRAQIADGARLAQTLQSTFYPPASPTRFAEFLADAVRVSKTQCLQELDAFRLFDVAARVAQIRVPTLVLAGERDVQCPPEAVRPTAAAIPGARYVLIGEAGHQIHFYDTDLFCSLLWPFVGAARQ